MIFFHPFLSLCVLSLNTIVFERPWRNPKLPWGKVLGPHLQPALFVNLILHFCFLSLFVFHFTLYFLYCHCFSKLNLRACVTSCGHTHACLCACAIRRQHARVVLSFHQAGLWD